jgi:hypothetical protein
MTGSEKLLRQLPNDIGGLPAGPVERVEHVLEPWEKRCHALADVLDFHKILNTEEKRRGVEALGSELIGRLTYYERWIAAFANILFQKAILTPEELARKMDAVAARTAVKSGPDAAATARRQADARLDEALEESFPASDPPAISVDK